MPCFYVAGGRSPDDCGGSSAAWLDDQCIGC